MLALNGNRQRAWYTTAVDHAKHNLVKTLQIAFQQELMRCATDARLAVDDLVQHTLGRIVPNRCTVVELDAGTTLLSPELRAALLELAPAWPKPCPALVVDVSGAAVPNAQALEDTMRVALDGRRLPVRLEVPVGNVVATISVRYTWDARDAVPIKLGSVSEIAKHLAPLPVEPEPAVG